MRLTRPGRNRPGRHRKQILVTVYIWNYRGSSTAWGHASLQVDGGTPAGTTYVSWWPSATGRVPKHAGAPGPIGQIYSAPGIQGRKYVDDVQDEEMPPDHTITLNGLDETAIKKWWSDFRNGTNQWKTLSQNCSTTVAQALKAGGADKYATGVSGWWGSWNFVWTPSDVLRLALLVQQGRP